jgi:ATP-binding cassette subfamily B (MDR/TAP) protein 1
VSALLISSEKKLIDLCERSLFVFVPDLSAAQAAANDFINLIDTQPSIDADSPEGIIPKEVQGAVELSDVFFHYPSRKEAPVLRGMNIVAKPGTYVALVGASGCGKSTIVQLVQRFYDPVVGSVKVRVCLLSLHALKLNGCSLV